MGLDHWLNLSQVKKWSHPVSKVWIELPTAADEFWSKIWKQNKFRIFPVKLSWVASALWTCAVSCRDSSFQF